MVESTQKGGPLARANGDGTPDGHTMRTVAWVNLFTHVVDRFGVPFGLLLLCLATIWVFGDDKTQNDFIREMLFGEVTGKPAARLFFLALLALSLVSSSALFRRLSREPAEMKRLADEKARLQERLIGSELSHTQKGPVP